MLSTHLGLQVRDMLKLFILGLACILLLTFISQHAFAQEAATYNNGVFAINYPSDWNVVNDNPTTFQPTGQDVQVTVTTEDSPIATTLQGYTNYETNFLTSELGASVSPPSFQGALAGFPAVVLGYRDDGTLSSGSEDAIEIFAFDNSGTLYKIVYSASPDLFETYFPVAKIMMLSFSLPGTNNAPVPTPSQGPNNFQPRPPSNNGCPTPGPGGCGGAFSLRGGPFSPLNPNFGQTPLQQNIPPFDPNG
jgi:hypothetical protein